MSETILTGVAAGIYVIRSTWSWCVTSPTLITLQDRGRPLQAIIHVDAVQLRQLAWGQKYSPR